MMLLAWGCQQMREPSLPATMPAGLLAPRAVDTVEAVCAPPAGWMMTPLEKIQGNYHQMWLSPSGHTAYGVIHIDLPLPVGQDFVLWVLMQHMREQQGWARLLSKERDEAGLRFVAEDPRYIMRGNLRVRGWQAWVIYAGTNRNDPVEDAELKLAEEAREMTRVGR